MPSICDPGEELVKNAKSNQLDVICVPGPCAAIMAVVSSGYECSKFYFEGFLAKKKIDREKIFLKLAKIKRQLSYMNPHRLKKLLIELKEYCGGMEKDSSITRINKKV